MEENREPKINILRKEVFKIKCPKRITIGDPYYFEIESPARLKRTGSGLQTAAFL